MTDAFVPIVVNRVHLAARLISEGSEDVLCPELVAETALWRIANPVARCVSAKKVAPVRAGRERKGGLERKGKYTKAHTKGLLKDCQNCHR